MCTSIVAILLTICIVKRWQIKPVVMALSHAERTPIWKSWLLRMIKNRKESKEAEKRKWQWKKRVETGKEQSRRSCFRLGEWNCPGNRWLLISVWRSISQVHRLRSAVWRIHGSSHYRFLDCSWFQVLCWLVTMRRRCRRGEQQACSIITLPSRVLRVLQSYIPYNYVNHTTTSCICPQIGVV